MVPTPVSPVKSDIDQDLSTTLSYAGDIIEEMRQESKNKYVESAVGDYRRYVTYALEHKGMTKKQICQVLDLPVGRIDRIRKQYGFNSPFRAGNQKKRSRKKTQSPTDTFMDDLVHDNNGRSEAVKFAEKQKRISRNTKTSTLAELEVNDE